MAQAVPPSEYLLHHPDDVAALGDAVTMAAMGGDNAVFDAQIFAHADGDRFLARIEMCKSRNLAVRDLHVKTLLEFSDGLHALIGTNQFMAC